MKYLLLLVLLTGCTHQIVEQANQHVKILEEARDMELQAAEQEKEKNLVSENRSLLLYEKDIVSGIQNCDSMKNKKDQCLSNISRTYFARINLTYPFADFKECQTMWKAYPDKMKQPPPMPESLIHYANHAFEESCFKETHNKNIIHNSKIDEYEIRNKYRVKINNVYVDARMKITEQQHDLFQLSNSINQQTMIQQNQQIISNTNKK